MPAVLYTIQHCMPSAMRDNVLVIQRLTMHLDTANETPMLACLRQSWQLHPGCSKDKDGAYQQTYCTRDSLLTCQCGGGRHGLCHNL